MEKSFATSVREIHKSFLLPENKSIVNDDAIIFLRNIIQNLISFIYKKWLLTSKDVDGARKTVRDIFPKELLRNAMSEGDGTLGGKHFIISLSEFKELGNFDAKSKLYVTGVLQYILDEVLDLAQMADSNDPRHDESRNVTVHNIEKVIKNDEEFQLLFLTLKQPVEDIGEDAYVKFIIENKGNIFLKFAKDYIHESNEIFVPQDNIFRYLSLKVFKLPLEDMFRASNFMDIINYLLFPGDLKVIDGKIDGVPIIKTKKFNNLTVNIIGGMLLPTDFKLEFEQLSNEIIVKLRTANENIKTYFDIYFDFDFGIFNFPNSFESFGKSKESQEEAHNDHLFRLIPSIVASYSRKLEKFERDEIISEKKNKFFRPFGEVLRKKTTLEVFIKEVSILIRQIFNKLSNKHLLNLIQEYSKTYNIKFDNNEETEIITSFRNMLKTGNFLSKV